VSSNPSIDQVIDFWDAEPCGTHFVDRRQEDLDFFERYRQFRYQTEWHIPALIPFSETKDKSVLEVGCGNGADGVMFALNGAIYTGVDLAPSAVAATRRHFELLGLQGSFQVENAERLSFADESFDVVYSYGVLHHTPNPTRAIGEVYRVLKRGGRAIVMLYNKHSFNYYVRIMLYMRLRVLARILSRIWRLESDRARSGEASASVLRGNTAPEIWSVHYQNFLRAGWSYLKAENFVHHCTDGPACPYAYVYTKRAAREAFSRFSRVDFKVVHFPLRKGKGSGFALKAIERFLARRVGWYLLVFATK
jgi:ubiquinone/menaquinone biosynthesis C-methylase UbiE